MDRIEYWLAMYWDIVIRIGWLCIEILSSDLGSYVLRYCNQNLVVIYSDTVIRIG